MAVVVVGLELEMTFEMRRKGWRFLGLEEMGRVKRRRKVVRGWWNRVGVVEMEGFGVVAAAIVERFLGWSVFFWLKIEGMMVRPSVENAPIVDTKHSTLLIPKMNGITLVPNLLKLPLQVSLIGLVFRPTKQDPNLVPINGIKCHRGKTVKLKPGLPSAMVFLNK
ncbi:hypothetical protein L6452_07363 [Arctium lappa]|uniref:Uncharacterized protein n=1 Tax=Arctium lappa TaxID=4217 RepID=A0ACB9EKN9_ARCLA|nr:hypothetical protein L6452_07363 [Arctium lappa]